MSRHRRSRPGLWCAGAALLTGLSLGCSRPSCAVELVSYKDPYFPEPYRILFDQCVFRVDAGGDLHVVGRATRDAGEADTGPITQYLHAHVFWQPKPGRTFANSTTTDATIRYVIVTRSGTAAYSGTGFVYPRQQRGGTLTARIETACLRLEAQFGEPPELLGDARLAGTLVADEDAHATVDLIRQLELHAAGQRRP